MEILVSAAALATKIQTKFWQDKVIKQLSRIGCVVYRSSINDVIE